MNELKPRIHDEANGLDYVLAGDYYIPAIELPGDDERLIGKWGADAPGLPGRNKSSSAQPPDFDGQTALLPCRPQ